MTGSGLMGRDRELAAVDGAIEALADGEGGFLVLAGEPGIGKSALLAEAQRRAAARGATVLAGRAVEFERELPFGVLVDALDAHLEGLDGHRLERMGVERVEELAAIFPALRDVAGEVAHGATDRHRAHRAVRELLDGLALARPLVLALDDLHWSDDASLELLAALVRRPPAGRVLVALAHRPSDALDPIAHALAGARAATRVVVGPLAPEHADALLGDAVPRARRAGVLEAAGGNPFFLDQLRRSPQAAGVPDAVAVAIRHELSALDADARTLLHGAAVSGEPFELSLAAAAADLPPALARAGADAAEAAALIRPDAAPGRFVFRHPLVRRAVYEEAGAGWRLGAHDRMRRALRALDADVALVAHHVERSAPTGDEEAVAILEAAADRALDRAPASAAHWYAAALRLLPSEDDARTRGLLEREGAALLATGHLDDAREALLRAGGGTLEGTLRLAEVERWLGYVDEALERLERARASLAPDDHRNRVLVELQLLLLYDFNFRYEEAERSAEAAAAAAELAGEPALGAAVMAIMADLYAGLDVAQGHACYEQAVAGAAQTRGDEEQLAELHYYLGWAATHLERYEEGAAHFDRGIEAARARGAQGITLDLLADRADPRLRAGRLREAIAQLEEAVEAARISGSARALWWALFVLGMSLGRIGEGERAEAVMAECEAVAPQRAGHNVVAVWTGYGRAMAAAAVGDHAGAAARLVESGGGPDLPHIQAADRHWARIVMVEAALARGDAAAAERWVREGEAWAAASGLTGQRGWAAYGRALLLRGTGEPEAAARAALAAVEAFDAGGAPVEADRARLLAGGLLAAAGDAPGGIALLQRAEAGLHAAGAEAWRARAARELRRLGRRVRSRAPEPGSAGAGDGDGELAALSAREREVAELVAEGHTNAQIAEQLFLSPKTVETHLRNVFARLGVSSRVAVAGLVERERHVGRGG